jgi:DNA polymerase/3'-5' exonuclease PolX
MMATFQSIPFGLPAASKVASYIVELLRPHCERIHIAGSIRRLQPQVKDIEIECEPKKQILERNLLGEEKHTTSADFIHALATITKEVIKGSVEGKYMQIITSSKNCPGIVLDLFMPRPEDYWRQLAIRTGSADYSHYVIAAAWSRKGWVGINGELYKRSQCDCKATGERKIYTLKTTIKNPDRPPVWKTEGEFFTWLGLEYIDPEFRIVSISNEAL